VESAPTPEATVQIIVALVDLIKAILWPAIAVWLLYRNRDALNELLRNLSEFSLEAGSFKASVRKKVEAAAMIGAAEATRAVGQEGGDAAARPTASVESIAAAVDAGVPRRKGDQLRGRTILWVDDRPSNNAYERRAFESLGIRVVDSKDTEDAINQLERYPFDLVITDMGRRGDPDAGLTLLAEMRRRGLGAPVVVYAGAVAVKKRREMLGAGAHGSTDSPQELFQLVTSALSTRTS